MTKLKQLSKVNKTTVRGKKRIGRGTGSGKGNHTVGRGSKGTKARSKVGLLFSGSKSRKSFIKRLPFLRGKAKLKSRNKKPIVINLTYLEAFLKTSKVNLETLAKAGIVDLKAARSVGVKILGEGEVTRAFEVELPISKSAAKKIEKAGGKIIVIRSIASKAVASKTVKVVKKTTVKTPQKIKRTVAKNKVNK